MNRGLAVRGLVASGVAAVLLMTPQLAIANQCDANVVGYWPLDGDTTEMVNGIAGTPIGSVSYGSGPVGQAMGLGGDGSYVDVGAHAALTDFGGDQMSIAAWVYRGPAGPVGDGLGAVITARTYCNAGNFQLYAHLFSEELYFSKWADPPVTEDEVSSSFAPFPFGEWKHVAATYTTDSVDFYVDGVLVDSVVPIYGGLINDELQMVQLGWDSCSSYYSGHLDEIVVYDTALTASEVTDLYDRGVAGIPACGTASDLVAQLVADIIGLNLSQGIANSLDAKLDAALKALEDLNTHNDVAAIGSLEAFINAVQAQRGGAIAEADADTLIATAQTAIDLIGS